MSPRRAASSTKLQRGEVVSVDRSDVVQTEHAEPGIELGGLDGNAGTAKLLDKLLQAAAGGEPPKVVTQSAHCGRVRVAVVVEHDHDRPSGGGQVVERLPGRPASQRPVADDSHHRPLLPGQLEGTTEAVGVAERSGRMRILHQVIDRLGTIRISRRTSRGAESHQVVASAGDEFVHVALVADIEDDRDPWRIKYAMQSQRQLDDTEVRSEMPAGPSDGVDQIASNVRGQRG
jgi:hypothetical protein